MKMLVVHYKVVVQQLVSEELILLVVPELALMAHVVVHWDAI